MEDHMANISVGVERDQVAPTSLENADLRMGGALYEMGKSTRSVQSAEESPFEDDTEDLTVLHWYHQVPVVNIIYDLMFDVAPAPAQIRDMLNTIGAPREKSSLEPSRLTCVCCCTPGREIIVGMTITPDV